MKATELRIGNYILINSEPVKVGYGAITDFYQKQKGIKNKYLDTLTYNPIPITSEILLACGFEKHEIDSIHTYVSYTIWIDVSCFRTMEHPIFNGHDYTIPCYPASRYRDLHQLQNLYFSLTGQELIYKP